MSEIYSKSEQEQMLRLARDSIRAALLRQKLDLKDEFSPVLVQERACFVTLHNPDGSLRGCIGNIQAFEPLIQNVIGNAVNAAFRDPRFPPVTSERELEQLIIEISVLTPPLKVSGSEDFIVGKHGIILKLGGAQAVFLPQVAPEQGWDRESTLSHLAMKAGQPSDAWRSPEAQFEVFEAIVFSEGKRG